MSEDVPSTQLQLRPLPRDQNGHYAASPPNFVSSPNAANYPLSSSRAGSDYSSPVSSATLSPQGNGYVPASPMGSGPVMGGGPVIGVHTIPPRPKPGRKPATDEPASKRKAQNRDAQRNFRARKAAKVEDLKVTTAELQNTISERDRMLDSLRTDNARLQAELDRINAELHQHSLDFGSCQERLHDVMRENDILKSQQQEWTQERLKNQERVRSVIPEPSQSVQLANTQIGCGNCQSNGECPCVDEFAGPPVTSSSGAGATLPNVTGAVRTMPTESIGLSSKQSVTDYQEIDFTTRPTRLNSTLRLPRLGDRTSISFMTGTDEDMKCGFCTDDSNCSCKATAEVDAEGEGADYSDIIPLRRPNPASANCKPGSCADCMANPQQKAWCESVSQLRKPTATDIIFGRRKTTTAATTRSRNRGSPLNPIRSGMRGSALNPALSTLEPPSTTSIGCNEAYRLFDGRLPMDRTDWIRNLRPVSPDRENVPDVGSSRQYSAIELESASVIASLTHSMEPLVPRATDGAHRNLVEQADEYRQTKNSAQLGIMDEDQGLLNAQ